MKATDLRIALDDARIPDDARAQQIVCATLRTLRDFLRANVTDGKGVGGLIFRALFPKTAAGITSVVILLDDYLADNCG